MLSRLWSVMLLVLVGSGFDRVAVADTTYWRVTLNRVTVVAAGSPQRCTRLAMQFLAFEGVLHDLANWDADFEPLPVAVYSLSQQDARRVFTTDADRRRERASDMLIYSKLLPGLDFNIAAIVDLGGQEDPLQSVLLLYAETMLTSGPSARHPPWYQLGVANLLNGLIVREDRSVLLNRNPPFEALVEAGHHPQVHYDLQKLLDTRAADLAASPDYREFMRLAREWAQYGLLTTEERRSHFRELATLMRQGEPAADAVKEAFGLPLEQVAAEFKDGRWRKDIQFRLVAPGPAPMIPPPAKLEPAEANTLLQVIATRGTRERPEVL